MTNLRAEELSLNDLLLDPNNYRFLDRDNFVASSEARFHESNVQTRAFERLKSDGLKTLKASILRNGFLPVDRIVVKPYSGDPTKYVVVEGNRRVASLLWIKEDHLSGIDVSEEVREVFNAVPCIVIEDAEGEAFFSEALMGIRHVGGIKEWGGYQRAKLVANLRDVYEMEATEVSERVGMSVQEVNRRYRAYKALEQMTNDDDYGDKADSKFYPIFHEAVSLPKVREEWLGWEAENHKFANLESLYEFYDLITPTEIEGDVDTPAKILTFSDVRQLRDILPNTEARRVLLDPGRSLWDAVAIAKQDELSSQWKSEISKAISALKQIGALELPNMSEEDLEELTKLRDLTNQLIETHGKLTEK